MPRGLPPGFLADFQSGKEPTGFQPAVVDFNSAIRILKFD